MSSRFDLSFLFFKSIALLKEYLQEFVLFGAAFALLGIISQFIPNGNSTERVIHTIASIILIMIQARITVSLILFINGKLLGEALSPAQALKAGGEFYWGYFGTNLLLGFRILVILIPLVFLAALSQDMLIYIVAGAIGFIGLTYMFIHYSFAPIVRVLNPEVQAPFATSYSLSKNYRKEIFMVFLIVLIISILVRIISKYVPSFYPVNLFIGFFYSSLVIPFSSIFSVIFYHFLIDQHNAEV